MTNDSKTRNAPTQAQQDAVFQRLMDLGRGFQPDLYDVAGEVCLMLDEAQAAGAGGGGRVDRAMNASEAASAHGDTCCNRPKPVVNIHGEPYCARCWTSLETDGLPIKVRA